MIRFSLLLFIVISPVCGAMAPNNAFRAFFWTQDSAGDLKNGCYGYNQIDSIASATGIDRLFSSFWLTYDWWHLRFKMSYMPTEIVLSKGKPAAITRCSGHFKDVDWFTGFKRTGSTDSINFFFPLLSQEMNYGRYDYFTVDVDASLDIEFYGAGDSIMVGTFVHKQPDARGAVNILGRNAFIVELTKSNPLRIKSIRCNGEFDSLLKVFLKFPLDSLKVGAAWYGVDILDTLTNVPRIRVFSLALSGKEPYLKGTKKDITWKLAGTSEIDSCLVDVSYDKMSWVPVGKTDIDSIYPWTIAPSASDSTIIRVIACGKHGERIAGTKTNILFISSTIWGLRVQ